MFKILIQNHAPKEALKALTLPPPVAGRRKDGQAASLTAGGPERGRLGLGNSSGADACVGSTTLLARPQELEGSRSDRSRSWPKNFLVEWLIAGLGKSCQ